MKQFLFLLLFAGLFSSAHAQSIKYTYDASGNRKTREKVISMLKSTTDNTGTTEVAVTKTPVYEDVLPERKITIYPNPTKGLLKIEIQGEVIPTDAKIYLYNVKGVLVRQLSAISESNTVDISSQPAGEYIMRITLDKDNVSTWKIIKD